MATESKTVNKSNGQKMTENSDSRIARAMSDMLIKSPHLAALDFELKWEIAKRRSHGDSVRGAGHKLLMRYGRGI